MPANPGDTSRIMTPLSDEEMDELDHFLMSEATSDDTMMLDTLDGYLTAIIVGPTTLSMSQWMSGIWGAREEDAPAFETMEQAQRIMDLIMRHYNGIIWSLRRDPDTFELLFSTTTYTDNPHEFIDGEMWAYGFMQGVELCVQDWQPLLDDPQGKEWLRPLMLLGTEEISAEVVLLTRWPAQREDLAKQIPASVAAIYRYWLPLREAVYERLVATTMQRSQPKVGRNDPCPCGSHKKFKRCCGAAALLH